ncbi:DUF51 family protein [Tieghemostelium lacteum]|uniref:DUF51 family protein n=1 Tax=Tieghemostelium lacteum TaxID=361077 RepID=A0A151ZHA1_TIELA|nr:DUF51 family protein [Tieghemostelium lacteum]|eukprot:KYQ93368.1 DUF51 family protein [Tieghemostelium lacteum]
MARTVNRVTPEMVAYCFDSLVYHLEGKALKPPTFINSTFPLFVTWKKEKGGNEPELRGCIGTFKSIPLIEGLNKFSLTSALKDDRFSPISAKELPSLHCAVSLLVDFEDAKDVWDWEIGTHGIWIEFSDQGYTRNSTYLPEVAEEQGWTQEKALYSLIKKAGYYGKVDDNFLAKVKLTRYQSSKLTLTYKEYKNFIEQNQQE